MSNENRMSDENWIRELAKVNLEQQEEEEGQLGERWDRLSSGELSAGEEAELLALAESSEEGREAYEAFRPLGPEFHASVVKAIQEQAIREQAEKAATAKPPAKLLPFSRRAQFAGWGTAAAIAAATLFLLVRNPALPPLPIYTIEPPQGDQDVRGETGPATGLPVYHSGSLLTLDASSEQDVTGPVEAYAFAGRDEELVPLKRPDVGNGMARLRGTLGQEIQLQSGEQTIWIVVSRPGKSPTASELQDSLRTGRAQYDNWQAVCDAITASPPRNDQWQVACATVRVEDQPPT
jgi:hypothetical protein